MRPNRDCAKKAFLTQPQCVGTIAQKNLGPSDGLGGRNRAAEAWINLFVTPYIVECAQGHMGAI